MIAVRIVRLNADRVFNLTSPRWLPEVALAWPGHYEWHNPRYEPLRDLIEETYVRSFNERTGHYSRLQESILREGVYNPVMLTTGGLTRRNARELPPVLRQVKRLIVCEYCGGSRLWVAQRFGLTIPAIINDYANLFPTATALTYGQAVAHLFKDQPRRISWQRDGSLYANGFTLGHFPENERQQRRASQRTIRREVVADVLNAVKQWIDEHERA
jgi:hypothetical protein